MKFLPFFYNVFSLLDDNDAKETFYVLFITMMLHELNMQMNFYCEVTAVSTNKKMRILFGEKQKTIQ